MRFSLSTSLLAVASTASLLLAGCGVGTPATSTTSSVMPAMQGTIYGGETPVYGATVTLWQTDPANSGYGVATNGSTTGAQVLATTTTNVNGTFSFGTPTYSCASGQFAYITATGGSMNGIAPTATGALINNNYIEMAALGSCSNFPNATADQKIIISINEVSTVAAAYALGNFMTINVNGNAGTQKVYVGAPTKNNATTGACTGNGSAMSCSAAGLAHAFANAAMLVDAVHYDNTVPTGMPRTTVPGNNQGSIPQAEINSLADVVAACVNSGGGTAGDTSTCGNLYTVATPSGGTSPTDTITALMNIAHNPQYNVGTSCSTPTSGVFCLIPAQPAFAPVLSLAPYDWSIAVTYNGLAVGSSYSNWGFATGTTGYPVYLALDANDNVYVLSGNAATSATSTTSATAAMSSTGVGIWANASTVDGTNGCYPGTIATDTNGVIWNTYAPSSGKSCTASIYGRSATSGSTTYNFTSATPYVIQGQASAIAFDRYNNLWYARDTSSGSTIMYQIPYTGTGTGGGTYLQSSTAAVAVTLNGASGTPAGTLTNVFSILIDPQANVYASTYSSSVNGSIYAVPNTNPTGQPTYTGAATYFTQALSTTKSGFFAFDASNALWAGVGASSSWSKITPAGYGSTVTGLSASSVTVATSSSSTAGTPYNGQIDGANTMWFPSFTSSGQLWYSQLGTSSTAPTTRYFYTCYAPNGGATCTNLTYTGTTPGAPSSTTAGPRMLQIDSTGAIWIAAETSGDIIEVIGSAAPVYPQISYGVFATKPQ